jgi:hypothetical protein
MNNYYFCVQGLDPAFETVWLNIVAYNEDDAYKQAFYYYRAICDLSNDDLIGLCMMEVPRC